TDLCQVYPHGVAVSATRGWGLERLLREVESVIEGGWVDVSVDIPYGRTELVALIHERGTVKEESFRPEGTHIRGRVPRRLAERFRAFDSGDGSRKIG
ncbi:MAG: GTPase HflX, partial [Chloroflexota bacterium]